MRRQIWQAGRENWGKVPQPAELSKKLSNLGLDPNKEIVLLGETLGGWGEDARVLWELRVAGYTNLKMVDGGYEALVNAGAETQKGPSKLDKVDVKIDKLDMTHDMETEDFRRTTKITRSLRFVQMKSMKVLRNITKQKADIFREQSIFGIQIFSVKTEH